MISLKVLSAAAVIALTLPAIAPTESFAQSVKNNGVQVPGGGARSGGGGGGAPRANFATPSGGAQFSGGGGGNWHGGGGNWHGGGGNWHHGGGGFIPGAVAGAVVGGAIAASGPRYYGGGPYYGGDTYYYDDSYAEGPVVVDGPVAVETVPGGDDVAYCMQTYKSYDRRSGTYLGYDGLRHPCP